MEQVVGYSPCLPLVITAALRLDGQCLEHPPELLGRKTWSWFSALPWVHAAMVHLGGRSTRSLDSSPSLKRALWKKAHGQSILWLILSALQEVRALWL